MASSPGSAPASASTSASTRESSLSPSLGAGSWPSAVLCDAGMPSRVVAIYDLTTPPAQQAEDASYEAKLIDGVVAGVQRLCQQFGRASIETKYFAAGIVFATLPDFSAARALVESFTAGAGHSLGPQQSNAQVALAQPHVLVPNAALLNDTLVVHTLLPPAQPVSGAGVQRIATAHVPKALAIYGCPIVAAFSFSSNSSGSFVFHAYVLTYQSLSVAEDALARLTWMMQHAKAETAAPTAIMHVGYAPLLDIHMNARRKALAALTARCEANGKVIHGFTPSPSTLPSFAGPAFAFGGGPHGPAPNSVFPVPSAPLRYSGSSASKGSGFGVRSSSESGSPPWASYAGGPPPGMEHMAARHIYNPAYDTHLNPGAQPFVMGGDGIPIDASRNAMVLMGSNAMTLTPFQTETGQIVYVARSLQGAPQTPATSSVILSPPARGKIAAPKSVAGGVGPAQSSAGNKPPTGNPRYVPPQKGRSRERFGSGGGGSGSFVVCKRSIRETRDQRTTVMVRNIPNKYAQQMLLGEIDEKFRGTYDFFYLPIDFKNRCNVGYAFINFCDPTSILSFLDEFDGRRWRRFNSEKICAVSYARIQGKQAMIQRFQHSSLMEKEQSYKPLLFYSDGPRKGQAEPFPVPAHVAGGGHHAPHNHTAPNAAGPANARGPLFQKHVPAHPHRHHGSYASPSLAYAASSGSNADTGGAQRGGGPGPCAQLGHPSSRGPHAPRHAPHASHRDDSDLGLGALMDLAPRHAQGGRSNSLDAVDTIEALMAKWQPLENPSAPSTSHSGSSSDSDPSNGSFGSGMGPAVPSSLGLGLGGWDLPYQRSLSPHAFAPASSGHHG